MPGRRTTDAIFAAKQVIDKHREMRKELHLVKATTEYHGRKFGSVLGSRVFLKGMCAA